jgi:hypothetical protein
MTIADDPTPEARREHRMAASQSSGKVNQRARSDRDRCQASRRFLTLLALAGAIAVLATACAAQLFGNASRQQTLNSHRRPPAAELSLPLSIQDVIRRGQIAEIKGITRPGASVMINGDQVPLVLADGRFTYLVVVPDGEFSLSITAQSPSGATRTLKYRGPED